jgi:hypothetical protein
MEMKARRTALAEEARRRYVYPTVSMKERERPHLVRERVKCGKSTCCCARDPGRRHGPYTYFRWERWDAASGRVFTIVSTSPLAK